MSDETVIEVERLRKVYGHVVAVDDVSLSVQRGEIFGLLGSNGAGKTTTVECIEGLRRPTAGTLRVLGHDPVVSSGSLAGRIGCQLQESRLPDHIKVWEALDLFAAITPGAADWRLLMQQWGLDEKRDASFASLSGGQRQRLFVALAFVSEPEIVFLDEMTTGLDPAARHVAWDLIEAIRDRGTTVVLVTHFMDEAERLCDRVAVVEAGRIVALDSPRGLIDRYGAGRRVIFTCPSAAGGKAAGGVAGGTAAEAAEAASAATDLDWLSQVEHVRSVERRGSLCVIEGEGPVLATVAAALVARGIVPDDLRVEESSLETVFLALTGHSVED
jgi:ABC-2 type transport system ATP-binding protein